ncbi:MAG: sigma-70 family RNA polymerase sigma factor [Clostridia bacterium]|nr:sigma-70 family RNA polymerase sigma factor [Clostridia bacterium]
MADQTARLRQTEIIIREYADMIYRIALQNLKNTADAEDIFQDVCLTLLTKNAPLFDDVHIKNWLIRVTINKCKNFSKSLWQNKTEPLDLSRENPETPSNPITELVYSLPQKYRNIVYLYYYEDYTVAEIAEILGENKNTINSRLQRARKKLKEILEEGDAL